ncbi:MAG: putative metal-binding motif-containing protein, partial [Myxococcales bacterium]|nr:putative metal-binding motif-containing protein [Myxococcales bacterium]
DDDCDGRVDEDFDGDGDGYPTCAADVCANCPLPDDPDRCRWLCDNQDCRDENVGVFPAAVDICGDGIDQNCDGQDAPCTEATGRVDHLAIAEANAPRCPDSNRDGEPDNALGLLGALANQPLADAVAGGSLNLFLAASGLGPPGTDGAFALSVLPATRAGEGYTVSPDALDEEGNARIRFAVARARDGALLAGPGRFSLDLPLGGIALRLTLYEAQIQGTVGVDEGLGLTVADGILWGAIRDVDLQAALDGLEADCAAAEDPAEFCGPLAQLRPALGNLLVMDQDLDRDGEVDGYGACLTLSVAPQALAGWPPE